MLGVSLLSVLLVFLDEFGLGFARHFCVVTEFLFVNAASAGERANVLE